MGFNRFGCIETVRGMTVEELIEKLEEFPAWHEVRVGSDPIRFVKEIQQGGYVPVNPFVMITAWPSPKEGKNFK